MMEMAKLVDLDLERPGFVGFVYNVKSRNSL